MYFGAKWFLFMRILISCLFIVMLFTTASRAQSKDEQAIRAMIKKQEAAWNKGDLEGFMKGYWENDSLMFIGKNGPTYGYKPTLARYQKGYPDLAHMGHFTSTILSMKRVSADCYFILGSWALKRSAGDVSGYYTLLIRKIQGAWVIVADHSS
jgi:ketosteroid isomerase-like protein